MFVEQTLHDHPVRALYDFNYPAVGDLQLAKEVADALHGTSINVVLKERDNMDHGAWIAANLLWDTPPAPIILISLLGEQRLRNVRPMLMGAFEKKLLPARAL